MKITDTISVNPGKTALGHVDASSSIFRQHVIGNQKTSMPDAMQLVFPSSGAGSSEFRKYSVPMRTLFATILIVCGISILTAASAYGVGFAVCSLCFGSFLAMGLFTRPVMLGASVYYCIMGALALRGGNADISMFALMFGCLLFGLFGSGKYSCDTLIRQAIRRHRVKAQKKRTEECMGYKAFHKVNY